MRVGWRVPLPGPFSVGGSVGGKGYAGCFGWLLAASVVFALLAWPYKAAGGHGGGAWLAEIGWLAFLVAAVVARAVYVHGRQATTPAAAPQRRPGNAQAEPRQGGNADAQVQRCVAAGQAASDAVKAMAAAQAAGDAGAAQAHLAAAREAASTAVGELDGLIRTDPGNPVIPKLSEALATMLGVLDGLTADAAKTSAS
jgi:hypothetical protein